MMIAAQTKKIKIKTYVNRQNKFLLAYLKINN